MNSPTDNSHNRTSVTVVERVADRLDADPLNLKPLSRVIDPDVLDAFTNAGAVDPESELRFRYLGCDIVVYGDGRIRLDKASAANDSVNGGGQ